MTSKLRSLFLAAVDMFTVALCFSACMYTSLWRIFPYTNNRSLLFEVYLKSFLIILPVYLIVFLIFGMYRSLWRYAQPKEYALCLVSTVIAGGAWFLVSRFWFVAYPMPFFFYVYVTVVTALACLSVRLIYRLYRKYIMGVSNKQNGLIAPEKLKKRTLIVGCGDAGASLLSEIRNNGDCEIDPVAAVDNDPSKQKMVLFGVRIVGTCSDITEVCEKHRVEQIIFAIPSANNRQRAAILDECSKTGCAVKMLPGPLDFSRGDVYLQKLRDITPDELLGRDPVDLALPEVRDFLTGRRIMVTGGGGSIGSELCRQIAACAPEKLLIVDIYENNAYDIEQELRRHYTPEELDLTVAIASVRDYGRLHALMQEFRPDIVFHAAAHKHVPLMEDSPQEAVKNNIIGTRNSALAAEACGVKKFILISTDKAVNPTNIMGASKRVCELIIQSMNGRSSTVFSAVRFGNVLGSNGSVIPLFKRQIADGGPVTVTHPDIIRFFMTIKEASQLVILAGAMAKGGEIFVLDMGNPVRIMDLARKMISLSGYKVGSDIEIKITGLRPGEKLYEELLLNEEGLTRTANEKIFIGAPGEVDRDQLFSAIDAMALIANRNEDGEEAVSHGVEQALMGIVPNFTHNN